MSLFTSFTVSVEKAQYKYAQAQKIQQFKNLLKENPPEIHPVTANTRISEIMLVLVGKV